MRTSLVRALLHPLFRRRIRIEGGDRLPTQGAYIVASNHVDFLDGFYLATAVWETRQQAVFFLTKTGNYGWTGTTIPIDPDNAAHALDLAVDALRQGRVIGNFIEGERNPSAVLRSGKTGTVRLALAAAVPIVPVGIRGTGNARLFGQSLWQFLWRRTPVTVTIGEPIHLTTESASTNERWHTLTQQILTAIAPLAGKQPPVS